MYNAFFRLARDYVCIAIVTCVDPSHYTHTLPPVCQVEDLFNLIYVEWTLPSVCHNNNGTTQKSAILTDKALLVKGKDNVSIGLNLLHSKK